MTASLFFCAFCGVRCVNARERREHLRSLRHLALERQYYERLSRELDCPPLPPLSSALPAAPTPAVAAPLETAAPQSMPPPSGALGGAPQPPRSVPAPAPMSNPAAAL